MPQLQQQAATGSKLMDAENADVLNLRLLRTVKPNDVITIRKDGTVLLNGKVQGDSQMELM